jgi:predicted nucleic acid-binding protein
VTRLDHAFAGVTRLGLDTSPAIYYIEAHPQYDALVSRVFDLIADGEPEASTSVVTLTEALTRPLTLRDISLQQAYRDLLLRNPQIRTLAIGATAAELAAALRARYTLRTPDAFQLAVAIEDGCQVFLTNDARLRRVTELSVLVLDDLEP